MQARRWRPLLVLATVGAALALGIGAPADVGSGSGPPTSIGHGGAAASVERLSLRPRKARNVWRNGIVSHTVTTCLKPSRSLRRAG